MKIIVHYPETDQKKEELACRAASVHGKAVTEYIRQLAFSQEKKIELTRQIERKAERETVTPESP